MNANQKLICSAFHGTKRIASGRLSDVARAAKTVLDRQEEASILIFDHETSDLVEVDFRGTIQDVLRRLPQTGLSVVSESPLKEDADTPQTRGPGRPRLGVIAREVTLLPRHWDWLNRQPGGASVALRKLVEDARRINNGRDRVRAAQESTYRFISAMAGNEPGFEEATRALFAGDAERFKDQTAHWPDDIREHARCLATPAFSSDNSH